MPQASGSTPNSDVIVDNTNSSRILYVNPPGGSTGFIYPWQNFQAGGFYNDTYSACLQAGCRAIFTFEGTRVAVYGEESYCVSDTQIWSSYSINGQDNVTHISGTHSASYLLFFQSEEMPFGQYTLYIYVGYAEDDCSYNLDWIEYNTTSSVVSSASSSTPSSSSTLTATHTSQSTTSTQSSGLSRSGGTDRAAGSNTGAIAGGVAAGVVVLLTALWLAYRQWKRRRASMGDAIFEDPSAVGEDLFASPAPFTTASGPDSPGPSTTEFGSSSGGPANTILAQSSARASPAPYEQGSVVKEKGSLLSRSSVGASAMMPSNDDRGVDGVHHVQGGEHANVGGTGGIAIVGDSPPEYVP